MKRKLLLLTLAGALLVAPNVEAKSKTIGKVAAAAGLTLVGGLIAYDLLTDDAPCYASCYVCGERLHHHEVAHWAAPHHPPHLTHCPHGIRCVLEPRPIVVNHVVVHPKKTHKPKFHPKREPPPRKERPHKKAPPRERRAPRERHHR